MDILTCRYPLVDVVTEDNLVLQGPKRQKYFKLLISVTVAIKSVGIIM